HRVRAAGTRIATNRGGTNGPHPSTRRNTRGHVGRDPGHVVISPGQRYVGDPRTGLGNARDEAGESIAAESRKRGGPSATGRAERRDDAPGAGSAVRGGVGQAPRQLSDGMVTATSPTRRAVAVRRSLRAE